MIGRLEAELRAKRDAGRKLLVPYITGGYPGWQDAIRACAANGADAVEIGIPFSDPVMDGPVIQQASQAALESGVTPAAILDEVPDLDVEIPLVVMTYYTLVHHDGHRRFAHRLVEAERGQEAGDGAGHAEPRVGLDVVRADAGAEEIIAYDQALNELSRFSIPGLRAIAQDRRLVERRGDAGDTGEARLELLVVPEVDPAAEQARCRRWEISPTRRSVSGSTTAT